VGERKVNVFHLIFNFIDMPRTRGGLAGCGGSSADDVPKSYTHGATQKKPITSAHGRGQHVVPALPDQSPLSGH